MPPKKNPNRQADPVFPNVIAPPRQGMAINTAMLNLVPNFSGEGDITVTKFLSKLNEVGRLSGWTEEEKFSIAKLKLSDKAENVFLTECNDVENFEEFSRRIIARFQRTVPLATQLQQLASCRGGKGVGFRIKGENNGGKTI